ncbi:MAG: protein kinase [Chloroflexi bacterium]|nr:protein kinase [Chloroflexota bacterium]
MADLSGRQLGPYLLQRKLGQGGMGAVYVGVHKTLQTERAIKVLLPTEVDEAVVERFVREGVISASLRHPNIVEIFDVGEQDDIHFLVMELVEGVSLLQLLRKEGAVPLDRVVVMLRQVASALDYAHARGVVHRDIKPSNIIVGPDDEVTLIDFGIARAMDESRLTRVGMVVGTFEYMAPEIVTEGGGSPGADRYALGVVAYQMLTGRTPFGGESAHSIMYKQVHETPPPPTRFRGDLPPGVDVVLLRQLAKQPEARFASSQAFVDALSEVAQQGPLTEDATSLGEVTRPGFEPPTPGSGQTPFPRSGRATRPAPAPGPAPAPAATMTPPGATALPGAGTRPAPPPPLTSPGTQPSTTPAPFAPRTPIPAAPAAAYTPRPAAPPTSATWPGAPAAPGTVLGAPALQQPKRSSAGLIVGIMVATLLMLVVIMVVVWPIQQRVSDLVSGVLGTATTAPATKPAATAAPTVPPTSAPAAVQPKPAPTTPPTAVQPPAGAPAPAQPKPAVTPEPPRAPTAPPTSAAPPTLTADQRLAQARAASAAGNHASALSMLDDLRRGNTGVPGLDDAQYDVHMAFGRSLLDGGNIDGSIEQFESALKVRPGDGAAQDGRKQALLTRNYAQMEAAWDRDQELAIKLLEENMQLDANFRETRQKLYALLIMKADRLLGAGEHDAAFPVLMRALDILPDAGEAQMRLVSYTPTPVPTATPRPVVVPQQPAQQQQTAPQTQPRPSGGSYTPPAPAPSSSGGSSCPGGVCP